MPRFPSAEWLAALQETLNGSAAFGEAAKGFQGTFLFVVEPEGSGAAGGGAEPKAASQPQGPVAEPAYMYLALSGGKCTEAKAVGSEDAVSAEFIVKGSYEAWKKVVQRQLEPVAAIMTRKLRLKGDMSKVMAHMKAVKELVNATTQVETEFPG